MWTKRRYGAVDFLTIDLYELSVACERYGDEPPRVIMHCTIFIAGQEAVQPQCYATPDDPALEIRLVFVVNHVVRKAEVESAQGKLHGGKAFRRQRRRLPERLALRKWQRRGSLRAVFMVIFSP